MLARELDEALKTRRQAPPLLAGHGLDGEVEVCALEDLDLAQQPLPRGFEVDLDVAPVLGFAAPADQSAPLQAVDETAERRRGQSGELAEPSRGLRAGAQLAENRQLGQGEVRALPQLGLDGLGQGKGIEVGEECGLGFGGRRDGGGDSCQNVNDIRLGKYLQSPGPSLETGGDAGQAIDFARRGCSPELATPAAET